MATPKIFTMRFFEAEHSGDVNRYIDVLRQCGATVLGSKLDTDAEEAVIRVEVPNFKAFRDAWEQTEDADFADSLGWLEDEDETP